MFRGLISLYSWRFPTVVVYMLQNTEYSVGPYLKWFWETTRFDRVMYRRTLDRTKAARLLLMALQFGVVLEVVAGLVCIYAWHWHHFNGGLAFGAALIIAYPIIWAHLVVVPLIIGREVIVRPRQYRAIKASRRIFSEFTGIKIAVAGSYGKTTMKELLNTVLSTGKRVAATPANKNVSSSHAIFAQKLHGNEEILIIEYGEGGPGDVERFSEITKPTHAVITGIAPAHLDKYRTLERAAEDIFSVGNAVPVDHVYVNGDSTDAVHFAQPGQELYDEKGTLGWHVSDVHNGVDGISFTMKKGKHELHLHSGLLGRHEIGPLSLVAALGHEFGLTTDEIEEGIASTVPFEHRMQPYEIGGAWIIDDTYNGNTEGIRVGLELLKELPAKRHIYVTPGLVDQGAETNKIHEDVGRMIAEAEPNIVVLMQHSVTKSIQTGLENGGFKGQVIIEDDPLSFYTNLKLFVAHGDVVLMQNDWPDNYR